MSPIDVIQVGSLGCTVPIVSFTIIKMLFETTNKFISVSYRYENYVAFKHIINHPIPIWLTGNSVTGVTGVMRECSFIWIPPCITVHAV
jgi:hypothetical protein